MSAFYAQMIAEELCVRPEVISLILGDTDNTPDGGYSAGFLYRAVNVRKVAAYTYQTLLGLAATQLGVPVSSLTVTDGIVSGGGKSISFPVTGKLAKADPAEWVGVAGLDGFSVTGDPPLKPVRQFKVIGTSDPMPGIPDKITGKTQWSCDVTLPGMLHARMVRSATLGSTLVSVGEVDKKQFPTPEVVRKGNLVAVVSPNAWEALDDSDVYFRSEVGATWRGWACSTLIRVGGRVRRSFRRIGCGNRARQS